MVKFGGQNNLLEVKKWFSINWKNWFWTTLFDKPCSICWARKWHMSPVWYKDWSALGLPKLGCFQTDSKNLGAPCILREMAFQFSHCFPIKYQFKVNEKKHVFPRKNVFRVDFVDILTKIKQNQFHTKQKQWQNHCFRGKTRFFDWFWITCGILLKITWESRKNTFFLQKKRIFGKNKNIFLVSA